MRQCTIDGCNDKHDAKGFCKKHYIAWRRRSSEFRSWEHMKQRCLNKNHKHYAYYGGRGIKICDRWRYSFESFLADMGSKPSSKHTIDRVDSNGNYEPNNCRWATMQEQSINKRMQKNNTSGITGVTFDRRRRKWYARINTRRIQHTSMLYDRYEDACIARRELELKYVSSKEAL